MQLYRVLKPNKDPSLQIGEAYETKKINALANGLLKAGFKPVLPLIPIRQKKPNSDTFVYESVLFTACKGEPQITLEDELGENYRIDDKRKLWDLSNFFTAFSITKQFHPCT